MHSGGSLLLMCISVDGIGSVKGVLDLRDCKVVRFYRQDWKYCIKKRFAKREVSFNILVLGGKKI